MIEPRLRKAIITTAIEEMSEKQKNKNYYKSLIVLDEEVANLIDHILAPKGYGCNILGIRKGIKLPENFFN
jgi:hypothetical protein